MHMHVLLVADDPRLDPQQGPDDGEDDADAGQDRDAVGRYDARAKLPRVEEVVRVEVRHGVGEVGEAEVEEEDNDEKREVEERERWGAWKEDLEEDKDGIQGVYRDLEVGGGSAEVDTVGLSSVEDGW